MKQSHLTDLLVRVGILAPGQAEVLRQEQSKWGGRFSTLVVEMGYLREDQLVHILSKELHLPLAPLERMRSIPSDALNILAATTCERLLVLPLGVDKINKRLQLAITDPTEDGVLHELRATTGFEIEPYVSTTTVIRRAIRINFYGENTAEVLRVIPELQQERGRSKVGSTSTTRPPSDSRLSPHNSGARPPLGMAPGTSPPRVAHATPVPRGRPARRSGAHPKVSPERDGGFRAGWAPQGPTASHPASLELDAATVAAERKSDKTQAVNPQAILAAQQTALSAAENQIATLQEELMQMRQQMQLQQQQLQVEVDEMQALLRNRFQEHRLLMRGLFDLLVARGYLNKDELVKMLSDVAQQE